MNTHQQHTHFRSRREREQEVDLVKKYGGIGIAAVAAAGARKQQHASMPAARDARHAVAVEAVD